MDRLQCSEQRTADFFGFGELIARIPLHDWVPGLAIADEHVLVGESINRQLTDEVRGASVAVLNRTSRAALARLSPPFREIYPKYPKGCYEPPVHDSLRRARPKCRSKIKRVNGALYGLRHLQRN
jgi:hypothetical protein